MLNRIVTISIFITIFISSYILFRSPFEGYITYLVMAVLFPIFIVKYGIPTTPLLIFTPLLISGIVSIMVGDNETALFVKIFLGFFSSVLFYRYVLEMYDFNVTKLFEYYAKGCVVVSVIGVIQVLSYLIGFTPGYDYSWLLNKWGITPGGFGIRMNSVFSEPAYFAAVVAPAFFLAVRNITSGNYQLINRTQSIIVAGAYFLTFSSLGIFGIFMGILLLLLNLGLFRYAIIFVPIFYGSFYYAYNEIDDFRERYDGTVQIFFEDDVDSYDIHGSSFVLYNNYIIAIENFKRNPWFGTGLGSHAIAFDRYSLTQQSDVIQINFNKADANSMFLRLLSETGIYGTGFMLIFLIRNLVVKRRSANDLNWVMSNGLFLIIFLYLARQGHYFLNGFPFFLWCFYYLRKQNQKQLDEQASLKESEAFGLKPEERTEENPVLT